METKTTDKIVPREIAALLSGERVILRETKRAVTPFGGVAVFISFLRKIDLVEQVRRYMPIQWKSPNHIDPTTTFVAFLITVLVGAKRFAHAALLRGDQALHTLLGMKRFPIRRQDSETMLPCGAAEQRDQDHTKTSFALIPEQTWRTSHRRRVPDRGGRRARRASDRPTKAR